jgi:hypothetical protein
MEIRTFTPNYNQPKANSTRHDPEGIRIRIRHDILDAAEQQAKEAGVTVKSYLNQKLSELLLGVSR